MSTDQDFKPKQLDDIDWGELGSRSNKQATLTDSAAANLEARLANEKDSRKEERFYWIFAVLLLIDVIVFPGLGKVSVTIISALQLILLIGLADFLGVDRVVALLENLLNRGDKN